MNDPGLEHELATLDLGDARLDRRARRVLQRCFESPQASLTAAQANWAEMMGAYRLFAHEQCTDQAQRMLIENALSDAVRFFHLDALSSAVGLKVDFDMALLVLASGLYRLLAQRMRGYADA